MAMLERSKETSVPFRERTAVRGARSWQNVNSDGIVRNDAPQARAEQRQGALHAERIPEFTGDLVQRLEFLSGRGDGKGKIGRLSRVGLALLAAAQIFVAGPEAASGHGSGLYLRGKHPIRKS